MSAYYNEIDPYAAQWLRNLISAGHIAPGDVDERSIEDVKASDLAGYTQCHFFAGIGVWSYSLRLAGWPDDRPVWTGSCPCPPFSAAGKGSECPSCGGKSCLSHPVVTAGWVCLDCGDEWRGDDRHLLPEFIRLIGERRPSVTFGEQVASRDGRLWLYTLRAVLERVGNAVGAADTCSAGSGAPHIRQRLRFVAKRLAQSEHSRCEAREPKRRGSSAALFSSATSGLADSHGNGRQEGREIRPVRAEHDAEHGGTIVGLANADGGASRQGGAHHSGRHNRGAAIERAGFGGCGLSDSGGTGPTNGFWRDADWLFCRDGKWRPVEPRPQPMVDGSTRSLGRVRAGHVAEIELEIAEWAIRYETDAGEALYDLRLSLSARAQREWTAGRLPDIHEAPILLAFLRQLQEQGWAFSERLSSESAEVAEGRMRVLRDGGATARAPRGRGLDEQRTEERPDALRVLSSILARHASEAWREAHAAYAATGFPLEHGARARVGRLRGYGNAVDAQATKHFIQAYLETEAERLRLTEHSVMATDPGVFG